MKTYSVCALSLCVAVLVSSAATTAMADEADDLRAEKQELDRRHVDLQNRAAGLNNRLSRLQQDLNERDALGSQINQLKSQYHANPYEALRLQINGLVDQYNNMRHNLQLAASGLQHDHGRYTEDVETYKAKAASYNHAVDQLKSRSAAPSGPIYRQGNATTGKPSGGTLFYDYDRENMFLQRRQK